MPMLEVYILVLAYIYIHTLCLLTYILAVKAEVGLCICVDSSEVLLLADAISTKILCTGPEIIKLLFMLNSAEQEISTAHKK